MKQSAVEWLEKELKAIRLDVDKNVLKFIDKSFEIAKEMEKEQSYSGEEVKNIMAETWIQCVGNDGNNFKEVRDKILNN
jgi:hypothetical protein